MADEATKKDEDLDFEDDLGDTSDEPGSDNSAPPADEKPEDNSGKRINDLMSRAQKAEAGKAKAEAALAKLRSEGSAPQSSGVAVSAPARSGDEFVDFARENARNTLFGSDPRFAEYGLTADAISGETIAEMRSSMAAQKSLIDGIESAARNKVLREHGLDPEVSTGAASETGPNFATMSDEDFRKFLKERDSRPR